MTYFAGEAGPGESPVLHAAIELAEQIRTAGTWGFGVEAVQLVYKAAGGAAVYHKGPLDRCLRDILTANQHVVATARTYEMAGRLLLGLEPLRFLF